MKIIKTYNELFENDSNNSRFLNLKHYLTNDNLYEVKKIIDGYDFNKIFIGILKQTILCYATKYSFEIMNYLLENGADPNLTHKEYIDYPIIQATKSRNSKKVKLLLKYNADVNVIHKKYTTLSYSLYDRELTDISYLLIDAGADWVEKNEYNKDLFDYLIPEELEKLKNKYPTKYKYFEEKRKLNNSIIDFNI